MQRLYLIEPQKVYNCDYCHRWTAKLRDDSWLGDEKQKSCSRCESVGYCDVICQKNHWITHKSSCIENNKQVSKLLTLLRNGIIKNSCVDFCSNILKYVELNAEIDTNNLKVIKLNRTILKNLCKPTDSKKCRVASITPLCVVTEILTTDELKRLKEYVHEYHLIIRSLIALECDTVRKYIAIVG